MPGQQGAPAACLARANAGATLGIDDLAHVRAGTRELVAGLVAKGGPEVATRKWDAFGRSEAMRDVVLCAPPKGPARRARAPPSAAAVESLLQDAWAAAQAAAQAAAAPPAAATPVPPPSLRVRVASREEAAASNGASPTGGGADTDGSPDMPVPASPLGATTTACASREGCSPASIFTKLEDMPTISEQFAAVA